MTAPPAALPRGSRAAVAPGDRSAGLRRGLVLLAIALTAMAGPLGRYSDHAPSDDVFRPAAVTSLEAAPVR